MTKPTNTDRIESARKSLNAPASKIAELEDAEAVLTHVLVETDAELEGMAGRRRAILAADGPATEIDKQLERHDEAGRPRREMRARPPSPRNSPLASGRTARENGR